MSTDTPRPRVTVVIPTHDRPRLLRDAVHSVLDQTMRDLEVVVVDDGSDPPVELGMDDPRLRLVRQDNAGVSAARNRGLDEARAPVIGFVDDDDRVRPRWLERGLATFEDAPDPAHAVTLGALVVTDDAGHVTGRRLPPAPRSRGTFWLRPAAGSRSLATKQTALYPVRVLRDLGGFDPTFVVRGPTELYLRLADAVDLVSHDEVVYELRRGRRPHLSARDPDRAEAMGRLWQRHRAAFRRDRRAATAWLADLSAAHLRSGDRTAAVGAALRAAWYRPGRTAARALLAVARDTA